MPTKLLESYHLNQKQIFNVHSAIYFGPLLTYIQIKPVEFFEERVFNDWDFAAGLMLLVLLDTVAGGIAHIAHSTFSGRDLYRKLATKLFGICAAVICIGLLKNTLINGEENLIAFIVDSGFYSVMLAFEGASVMKNLYKIYPWEPIKFALSKLEVFYDKKENKVKDYDEKDK